MTTNLVSSPRKRSRLHLLGLMFVVAVATSSVLLPHPAAPTLLPMPELDRAGLARQNDEDVERARLAAKQMLPGSIRLVGELFRRMGAAIRDHRLQQPLLEELRLETRSLVAAGRLDELLTLRALQSQLFIDAVHDWRLTERESLDLVELGADFSHQVTSSWVDEDGQLVLSDAELRLLFRVRWGKLTDTYRTIPFGPSLEEFRAYYGIYLRHPEGSVHGNPLSLAPARLRYVRALGKLDPDYPSAFASGLLLSQLGDQRAAARHFRSHLESSDHGHWNQAAKNHLLYAVRTGQGL